MMDEKQVIEISRPLEELIKGSLEYEADAVRRAFGARFGPEYSGMNYGPIETFPNALIVAQYGNSAPDEFFRVPFTQDGGSIIFADRDAWEPVELTYKARPSGADEAPAVTQLPAETAEPVTSGYVAVGEAVDAVIYEAPVTVSGTTPAVWVNAIDPLPAPQSEKRPRGKRLEEQLVGRVVLAESADGGPRKVHAIGITAGVVNGNSRRYPADTLRAAVANLRGHLHESAGQGRLLLLGEAEHPSSKGGRSDISETVVKWDDVAFDEDTQQVQLDGHIIETAKGRDILALIEGGVYPGVSQRGYGRSVLREEAGEKVEEVVDLTITGYDLVSEPSDPQARVTIIESQEAPVAESAPAVEDETMDAEKLAELIRANPDVVRGVVAEDIAKMGEQERKDLEEKLRGVLGVDEEADLFAALAEAVHAKQELAETKQRAAVEAAIAEASKNLKYGEALNKLFAEGLRAAGPESPEQVAELAEAKRKEYDAIVAAGKLAEMGKQVEVIGPVIETATNGNWPEYAKVAFEYTESLVKSGNLEPWQPKAPKNKNQRIAAQMLEHFDAMYKPQLLKETRAFEEATTAAGLNLPYGVSRAILGAVWPTLVATGLFDVGVTDQAPLYIYYESYADETGKHVTSVTREEVTSDLNVWVSLAHKRLQPGTVVVENHANNVTYTEGTDYIIDYTNGAIMEIATIGETNCHVTYHYDSVREGEGANIQNGKMTLSRTLMDVQADRLATQVNNEALVFSRSQLGYDVTNRTLMSLINEVRRIIDANLMYDALSASLGVASNSGGTWTSASDPLIDFVTYIGASKDKIAKRYYTPTGILMSSTRADALANWDGFTAAGKRPDSDMLENGYLGRIKGLPVFSSTEFSDSYALVFNRQHVFHRVYQPMVLKGPFQTYGNSGANLVAAEQWYAEEYNGTVIPVRSKASHVVIA